MVSRLTFMAVRHKPNLTISGKYPVTNAPVTVCGQRLGKKHVE